MREKKTQIRVAPELARKLKMAALLEKRHSYEVAEEAIRKYLDSLYPELPDWMKKQR